MKKVQPAGAQLRVKCGSLGAELEATFYLDGLGPDPC